MKTSQQDFSKFDKKGERLARTPSPNSANGGSTTDDGDGDGVLESVKVTLDPQKNDSAVLDGARGGRGQSRNEFATETKLFTRHSSRHESTKDENTFSKNPAGNIKRHTESLSASLGAVDDHPKGIHPAPEAKAKLGKIGGKKKVPYATSEPLNQFVEEKEIPHHKSPNHASPGADIESSTSKDHSVIELTRTGRPTAKVESPLPRETSQERANRKRAELKRNLADKSKSAAKKKRKF